MNEQYPEGSRCLLAGASVRYAASGIFKQWGSNGQSYGRLLVKTAAIYVPVPDGKAFGAQNRGVLYLPGRKVVKFVQPSARR